MNFHGNFTGVFRVSRTVHPWLGVSDTLFPAIACQLCCISEAGETVEIQLHPCREIASLAFAASGFWL
jgi:hypothetical protein